VCSSDLLDISHIDAIKIDVQGLEFEVLTGLREVMARDRPVVWCDSGKRRRGHFELSRD